MILSPYRAQNSSGFLPGKFQFVEQIGASSKMLLMFLSLTKSLGHVWCNIRISNFEIDFVSCAVHIMEYELYPVFTCT